ncbi:MAG: mandelate racemase/muconate lactonizing enzyme family protein [Acidobacteriia bacterium]|nr:mandelate racemase/muconate lactonizing enzyme family protein [Terriglobia bacterium]
MKRRSFLGGAGLAAAARFAVAQEAPAGPRGGRGLRGGAGGRQGGLQPLDGGKIGNTGPMKITDIKTFLVGAGGRNWVYVKILTDQGLYGIGEAYSAGPDEATVKVIEDFKLWLVGQDPRNVQYLFDLMYNTTRFPGGVIVNSAISGIEHALWDIAGKSAGVPVWALLGGRTRNKIRTYQSTGGGTPQQAGENAKRMVETYGYTALKMGIQAPGDMPYNQAIRQTVEHVRAVREAVGPDVDIGVDVHAKFFEVQRAIRLAHAIEPYNPMWMEESIRTENFAAMKKLSDHVNIPLASGECNYMIHEFRPLLELQALDFVQPDICCCGGVLTMKKIAAMAEAQYIMVAPHNPMSPLATAVNVHFAASTPNFHILEYSAPDSGARKNVLKEPLMVKKDGYLEIPNKPGWGVELNEEAFKSMPPAPWKRGTSFRADGSPYFQ